MSEQKAVYINHGKVIGGAPNQLDNLSDVDIQNPSNDQILGYDGTTGRWSNKSVPAPTGKADKVDGATSGDIAGLDSSGNLTDTNIAADDVLVKSSTSGLVKNDGTIDTNQYLTGHQDISGKADKVDSATNGDLAGLDSNGNLTDSGVSASNVVVKSATAGLIKNDGTIDTNQYLTQHQDISGKADKVSSVAAVGDFAALDSNGNLTDSGVKVTITTPSAGQALMYDTTNSVWSNQTVPSPEGKADKVSGATNGNLAGLDGNGNLTDSGIDATNVITKSSTAGLIKNDGTIDTNTYVETSDIGTAAAKDSTNAVTAGSTDLVESGAVKTAIDNAVSALYHPSGDKTVAELVAALLIADNLGNVYNMTDAGTTTSDFTEGAGKPIRIGDNVGIVNTGTTADPVYKFDLLSGFVDLTNYVQKSSTAGLVKNDGTVDTNQYLTQHQDISGKADIVTGATSGDLAALDGNGNLTDSGVKVTVATPSAGQALMYDTTNNAWTNQTVPSPDGKADKVSGATNGDLAALDGNGNLTDSGVKVTITTPTAGQALMYDTTNNAWTNQTVPSPEGKADKVSGATSGHLAGLDSTGNLTDSGIDASDVITVVSGATAGNFAKFDSNGNIEDSGKSESSFTTSSDLSTLYTQLWGQIPVNPDDTSGLVIWIETE